MESIGYLRVELTLRYESGDGLPAMPREYLSEFMHLPSEILFLRSRVFEENLRRDQLQKTVRNYSSLVRPPAVYGGLAHFGPPGYSLYRYGSELISFEKLACCS